MLWGRYGRRRPGRTIAKILVTLPILILWVLILSRSITTRTSFIRVAGDYYRQAREAVCSLFRAECPELTGGEFDPSSVPTWDGHTISVIVHGNIPYFTTEDLEDPFPYISYSGLDSLGRCRSVSACLSSDLLPTRTRDDGEERSMITPTGFVQTQYSFVDRTFLWNRSHCLAWQLGGDTVYENLITGTRTMNAYGMLRYENEVASYLRLHRSSMVLYRVTPIYEGNNLVCSGVLMEYYSINDNGRLHGCVYLYNEEPGVIIDHADGESWAAEPYEG